MSESMIPEGKKKYLYWGGGALVLVVGYLYLRGKKAAAQAAQDSASQSPSYIPPAYGAPLSYGAASGAGTSGLTLPAPQSSNIDWASLIPALLGTNSTNGTANSGTVSSGTATSTSDAGSGGAATVSTPGVANQQTVNQVAIGRAYSMLLGRNPDQGGLDYFTNLMNNGVDFGTVVADIQNSPEYASLHPAANTSQTGAQTYVPPTPAPTPAPQPQPTQTGAPYVAPSGWSGGIDGAGNLTGAGA